MKNELIEWIREYFKKNGNPKAVIGISGGTDSSVAAAAMCEAIGKENVIGVLMPNGYQHDIDVSLDLVNFLGIKYYTINIKEIVDGIKEKVILTREGVFVL